MYLAFRCHDLHFIRPRRLTCRRILSCYPTKRKRPWRGILEAAMSRCFRTFGSTTIVCLAASLQCQEIFPIPTTLSFLTFLFPLAPPPLPPPPSPTNKMLLLSFSLPTFPSLKFLPVFEVGNPLDKHCSDIVDKHVGQEARLASTRDCHERCVYFGNMTDSLAPQLASWLVVQVTGTGRGRPGRSGAGRGGARNGSCRLLIDDLGGV